MDQLFTLKVRTSKGLVIVRAYENAERYAGPRMTHTGVDLEVRLNGREVFARGALYIGIPGHQSIDGQDAKRCALSCVAMKPGDTDADYFKDYSAEQLDFARALGDELSGEAYARYGED